MLYNEISIVVVERKAKVYWQYIAYNKSKKDNEEIKHKRVPKAICK